MQTCANQRRSARRTVVFQACLASVLLGGVFAGNAHAQDPQQGISIGLKYALGDRPSVIVLPATAAGPDSIRTIIQRDLDYDNRAIVMMGLDDAALRAMLPKAGKLNYALFEKLQAVAIVHPTVTAKGLHIALHDVAGKKMLDSQTFVLPADSKSPGWRLAVHIASDEIGSWLFGSPGIAATRILYVYNSKIWMIDSDGANAKQMTSGMLDLSPQWHPNGTLFTYSGYSGRGTGSQIAIRNLATGETNWKTSSPRGLNITPAFSPDGRRIAYAHGLDANTDIVIANVNDDTRHTRLTVRGLNTSPSFSPDGRRITFMSGRVGHPEIYTMDADGTNPGILTEFTYGESSYRASPDWSPDGRMVAYQSQIAGRFQIMTIDFRDRTTTQYTSDGENEDPSWAPDSRHIVFSSTRSGARQLWIVDVASGRMRQVTRQAGAKLPAWSPRLGRP